MSVFTVISRKDAYQILTGLSEAPRSFKNLEELVRSTRTLSRRLRELSAEGLVRKLPEGYMATPAGLDALLTLEEASRRMGSRDGDEWRKIGPEYLRPLIWRLAYLFGEEFQASLISFAVFGSVVQGSFQPGASDLDALYVVEKGADKLWEKETRIFRRFRGSWEYRLLDAYMKARGLAGHPDVELLPLTRDTASKFQPVYLDMLNSSAILYDKEGFLKRVLRTLRKVLDELGSVRVEYPDGSWGWMLKPDLQFGHDLEISLADAGV